MDFEHISLTTYFLYANLDPGRHRRSKRNQRFRHHGKMYLQTPKIRRDGYKNKKKKKYKKKEKNLITRFIPDTFNYKPKIRKKEAHTTFTSATLVRYPSPAHPPLPLAPPSSPISLPPPYSPIPLSPQNRSPSPIQTDL
ncbi:unnamed protein product [Bursaphelenchus xylophilus]|uniref:(pine wood nematode) hypothetical protein n=1 Tax=Bursaphelenchus xylophilus TaxID=6326 RepID=A0A7I8XQ82_BURXY|nr:unnamed protein product [Bursaphelenchus xylophilus]CAG9088584.1 unnamed protein product [Bursaphelenchus xylophilus]